MGAGSVAPPRVLVVMPARGPRALLRAELLESGYDAVGVPSLAEAAAHPVVVPGRGPVRVVLVDQAAWAEAGEAAPALLGRLRAAHVGVRAVLLARAAVPVAAGAWDVVLRRPVRIGDIVAVVRRLVSPERAGPGSGGEVR